MKITVNTEEIRANIAFLFVKNILIVIGVVSMLPDILWVLSFSDYSVELILFNLVGNKIIIVIPVAKRRPAKQKNVF